MLMRDEIKAAAEAVLFVRGEQVPIDELVEILDVPLLDLKGIMQELVMEYNEKKRGLQIVFEDYTYLMCTRAEYSDFLARMNKTVQRRLSPAAMETLALIAYQQPVTRTEIESIRGVKSDKVLNHLLDKGLICEAGHKAVLGKPIVYATTQEFLRIFGLAGLKDLPRLEEDKKNVRQINRRRDND
ncbi:MAG: SMC-Scp complex subunit ScpB [Syntrophomonadaceae bacterium]